MKYCSNCGEEIKNNSKFCSDCGTKINNGGENDFSINGDVNLNITNKTTEKIIDDVSRNVKNTTNKTVGLFKKILPIALILIVIGAIVIGVLEKQVNDRTAKEAEKSYAAIDWDKVYLTESEAQFNDNRKKSDEKYWNNGDGIYFKSKDNASLKVAIKTLNANRIYVWDKIYEFNHLNGYGDFGFETYKLYYDERADGSYDIVQIDVSGSNVVDTTYYNSDFK